MFFLRPPAVDTYQDEAPALNIQDYFNGEIEAWGFIQDFRGKVISRFDGQMIGQWDGNKGTLKETFTYYHGFVQERLWHLERLNDGRFRGQASDIIGEAQGAQSGNAFNFKYTMNVPVDDKTYHFVIDDWMWQMNDGVLINRSYLRKFGFTVAELTVFMKKKETKAP